MRQIETQTQSKIKNHVDERTFQIEDFLDRVLGLFVLAARRLDEQNDRPGDCFDHRVAGLDEHRPSGDFCGHHHCAGIFHENHDFGFCLTRNFKIISLLDIGMCGASNGARLFFAKNMNHETIGIDERHARAT